MSTFDRISSLVTERRRRLDHAAMTLKDERAKMKDATDEAREWLEAKRIIQEAGQAAQEVIHGQIAGTVSRCLAAVYDDAPAFKIEFERKRGRTEARAVFRDGDQEFDPVESDSLGMVDVAAFALRVACLRLHRPKLRQTLVLDEPFRFVGEDAMPRVRSMMLALSKETGIQFIVITHSRRLHAGEVIEL